MARRRSLSNNDRNRALGMLQVGLSCRNVAVAFGVARTLTHKLRTAAGVNVSYQKIRNRLRSRNLRPRRPAVRIPIIRHHRRLGSDWCWRHLRWTVRQWSTVCFSDALRFNLRFNDGRIIVYSRPGERYSDANIREHDGFVGDPWWYWQE